MRTKMNDFLMIICALYLLLSDKANNNHSSSAYGLSLSSIGRRIGIISRNDPKTTKKKNIHLPPGRPTPRFINICFDDSLRLLNPKTMKTYQLDRKEVYGDIFKTNIFGKPTVFCTSKESLKLLGQQEAMVVGNNNNNKNKMIAFFPPHHQRLFGPRSLLVTSGATHSQLRGLIQPCLSPATVKTLYQTVIDEAMEDFLQELRQKAKSAGSVALVPELRTLFVGVVLQLLFPKGTEIPDGLIEDLTTWSRGLLAAPLTFIPWSTAGKAIRARQRICDKLLPILEGARQQQQETNIHNSENENDKSSSSSSSSSSSLISRLISSRDDYGNALTNDEIIDNLLTLIFAGSDTTASSAASMWMMLLYKDKKKKNNNNNNDVKTMDPDSLVQQVLEEYPPAPFGMRLLQESITLREFDIPKGWLVVYGFAGAMNAGSVLLPPTASSSSNSNAFGAGPRMCPGRYLASMELTILCEKLQQECSSWSLVPDQDLTQTYTPGLFPKDNLLVKLNEPALF